MEEAATECLLDARSFMIGGLGSGRDEGHKFGSRHRPYLARRFGGIGIYLLRNPFFSRDGYLLRVWKYQNTLLT